MPLQLYGRLLESYGYRLVNTKVTLLKTDWKEWSQEMQDTVSKTLMLPPNYGTFPTIPEWITLEHQVAEILTQQEIHGWYFDERLQNLNLLSERI